MKARIRADQLVFEQGLAESREKAKSLIMAGRVLLQGPAVSGPLKPGRLLPPDTVFELKPGRDFVSRGAYKLATILDALNLDVTGFVCLDAGASTGGFTDCLLQRGAAKVYAVDVGKNQLHEKLRADARVISMEGVNLRTAPPGLLPEKVDLVTGDVSFISLTHILPVCSQWAKPGARAAILIKPQFELGPEKVHKGVVRNDADRLLAVEKIIRFCEDSLGWHAELALPAKIRGPKGNQEYMALFRTGARPEPGQE
ncbi:MAG: TlyA family RNA methyltransferase [Desulfovibrio sp.]|nr:TlyA family RNA methyltransferase [Desulfovibrio sp.]